MRYPDSFLDEIRARLPVSQIVGRKVKLKKQGREFAGLSPFNSEKTPSFYANDAKAKWFDMSAGRNGDIFSFLMETEGLSFPDAVERLAGEAGLPLPKSDAESVRREAHRRSLVDIVEEAAAIYRTALAANAAPRQYLADRGITAEEIEEFGIGYAPDDPKYLWRHLSADVLPQAVDAGVLVKAEDGTIHDRFRGRAMFPIRDLKGRTVGFGGRDLTGKSPAKYLNSPECPVFDKGRLLYNADKARQPAHDGAEVVCVEGYAGTLASIRAGFPATVATMGTALTEDQVRSLWRLADVPVLAYDGDRAGRAAVRRAIGVALPHLTRGRSLRFATLPDGLDPDDMVRQRGAEAYRAVIGRSIGLADALWRAETEGRSLSTPEEKDALLGRLLDAVGVIPGEDLRKLYVTEYRKRVSALDARPPVVRSNGRSSHSASPGAIRLAHPIASGGMPINDAMVIAAMLKAPAVALQSIERIVADESLSAEARTVVGIIADALAALPDADAETLRNAIAPLAASETVAPALAVLHAAGIHSLDLEGAGDKLAAAVLTRH